MDLDGAAVLSETRQAPGPLVECYSGHTYAQEPRALVWEGRRYPVAEVEARWRTPTGPAFQLRTASGERFEADYSELEDRWTVRSLEQPNHYRGQGGPTQT